MYNVRLTDQTETPVYDFTSPLQLDAENLNADF